LSATKVRLEEQEKAVTQFKRQFMGELPEQREANLKVLEQLQSHYQRIGEAMRAAQDRKLIIQKQLSDTELLIASAVNKRDGSPFSVSPLDPPGRPVSKDPQEIQLEQMRNQLSDLQGKYTERHPDILVMKKKIADLEAKLEKERSEKKSEESRPSVTVTPIPALKIDGKKEGKEEKPDFKLNPRYKEMEAQLIGTELEIERWREEEAKVKAQINRYRERIEMTPVRELAMTQLTRDYLNMKDLYQTLLKKSEEAQQAENLERRQKGEQFKVIDPARVPETPFKPDIPKTLLFGLLLGAGCGLGMAFFREQMDRSFRDAEDLETTMGFKVLANIPTIQKEAA
jgi:polysaccharide chain length determinant protein (PEP-CTERM system associated)